MPTGTRKLPLHPLPPARRSRMGGNGSLVHRPGAGQSRAAGIHPNGANPPPLVVSSGGRFPPVSRPCAWPRTGAWPVAPAGVLPPRGRKTPCPLHEAEIPTMPGAALPAALPWRRSPPTDFPAGCRIRIGGPGEFRGGKKRNPGWRTTRPGMGGRTRLPGPGPANRRTRPLRVRGAAHPAPAVAPGAG